MQNLNDIFSRINNQIPLLLSICIRGIGMLLQFISTIVIARFLGAEQMGLYSVYLATMMVLSGTLCMGTPTYVMKQVSVLFSRGMYSHIFPLLRYIFSLIIFATTAVLIIYGVTLAWPSLNIPTSINPLFVIFAALIFACLKIVSESLKSIGKVNLSIIAESAMLAGIMIACVLLFSFFERSTNANTIIQVNIFAMAMVLIIGLLFLNAFLPKQSLMSQIAKPNIAELTPYWGNLLIVMGFINAPMLVLPLFASETEVGIFSIAYRLILIMINILGVLAAIFGPKFAIAYSQKNSAAAWLLLKKSGQYSFSIFAILALILVLFNDTILNLFGEEFKAASTPLFIMLVGQAIYASTGLVGLFLSMTGKASTELKISTVCIVMMYSLLILAGCYFGMLGIAIAFSAVVALKNLLSLFASYRSLQSIH